MTERWVLNASPIICLSRAGYMDLVLKLANEILIHQAVAEEIQAGPEGDLAKHTLSSLSFANKEVEALPEILAWDLGSGETAVVSFTLANPGWTAIIDDRAARKCARSYSLPHKGTLAVMLLAKKSGIIPSAADAMRSLKTVGLRLDDETVRLALKEIVDEEW